MPGSGRSGQSVFFICDMISAMPLSEANMMRAMPANIQNRSMSSSLIGLTWRHARIDGRSVTCGGLPARTVSARAPKIKSGARTEKTADGEPMPPATETGGRPHAYRGQDAM